MKKIIAMMMLLALPVMSEPFYLEVTELTEETPAISASEPTFVRIECASKADAESNLVEVITSYFAGLEYKAEFHAHYHGPDIRKPCELIPLKSQGLSKYVEIYTDADQYHLPEIVRVACTDAADADKKAKDIKKTKWFKDKTTYEKVKL